MSNINTIKIFGKDAGIGNQLQFIPCLKQLKNNGFELATDSDILKKFFPDYFYDLNEVKIGILIYNLGFYHARKYKEECDKLVGFKYSVKGKILPILSRLFLVCSPTFDLHKSEILNNFRLLDCFWNGFNIHNIDYSIPIYRPKENCIGIAASSGKNPEKRWKYWPGLINKLVKEDYKIELYGLDIKKNQQIKEEAGGNKKIIVKKTKTLLDAAKEISKCKYFITNDTGLMHLVDALRIPVIAIFGMTNIAKNRPWNKPNKVVSLNLSCSPCYKHGRIKCNNKTKYKCMKIKMHEVYNAFLDLRSNCEK